MARKHERYIKSATESLEQALRIVKNPDGMDKQSVRAAARQAQEAMAELYQLAGAMEAETENPPPAPAKATKLGIKEKTTISTPTPINVNTNFKTRN